MKILTHTFSSFALLALACFTSPLQAQTEEYCVLSPDGLTYLNVRFADGRLTYNAGYSALVRGKKKKMPVDTIDVPVVLESPLGVYTNVADFSQHLTLVKASRPERPVRYDYRLRQGKQRDISSEANALELILSAPQRGNGGVQMAVQFRVFNNNIAYRYRFLQNGETGAIVVTGEASGFRLPTDATAFICPQSDPMIGWKRTKPSYEEEYIWDEPVTTRSRYGHGWTFPCLFKLASPPTPLPRERGVAALSGAASWLLISETGVSSNYCGSHLSDATADGLFTIAFPMEGENNGFGSTGAQVGLANSRTNGYDDAAGYTPWRTLTFGPSLKPIVETTVTWDVVEPLYEPSIDYQGSRNTWSWIIWQDPSINYDDQVAYINLAADLGWEGCLIDGGWYQNIGREGMERLFDLCKQKGVRPWVWYNSNGGWNDAPQCARQAMHNPIVRKKEMRWLQEHGVAGIKVDFFAGDKQETLRLYEAILSDANDFGIQVIFHGCTLPRGWERMYPNYCGSEAVLASENLVFNQHFCDMEAQHACLHPFVRNTVGSMEFGGTVLQRRLNRGNDGGTTRRTSDIFELATAVAFQSSGQNFALTPRNLTEQPAFEIDFMRQVPTTWDETRFIDGYPGKYLVMARRHADQWYIVAMNAAKEPKTLTIDLAPFGARLTTLLHDGADGQKPQSAPLKTDKRRRMTLTLQPQCAAVVF
ncbi:MAG: glycoside hydrolase family 97 protein [Bacteroidales bacterium]|nr:glycoside hydrolase family 97 protein [Bacteroidales bacterium]